MKYNHYEKALLVFLSAALLTGAFVLGRRNSRTYSEITVTRDAVKARLTIEEVESLLRKKRKVNINSATEEELTSIPGIGPALAGRIAAFREEKGSFCAEKDLLKVRGIGPKKLAKMKEFIKFDE
ncbi:MAG: hypothetical protein GF409_05190 [Candidatus Omnitrophica bacterium]|nr:hypothetical protein [Candidatus Omnitrophota bacterium]